METKMMETKTMVEEMNAVSRKYGPWHYCNIYLQDGVYTMAPKIIGDEIKLRRVVQCISDHNGGSLEGLRILDLGCGEGIYSIELARRKAQVVAMDGRETHLEKVRFIKRVLSLDNLEVVQDDVRNLSLAKYGKFDVVLCLGILYHLKAPDVFSFIERLNDVCQHLCIVDTRVNLRPKTPYTYDGETYWGGWGEEHWPGDSKELKLSRIAASLDDDKNFYLSRPTLYNRLFHVGFTSVYECHIPMEPTKPKDRFTFIAIKGRPCSLIGAPLMATRTRDDMPERPFREHTRTFYFLRAMSHLLPWRVRRMAKGLLGLENKLT